MKFNVRQLTIAALFVAIGVALSTFSIPIGASRCFPIQHFVNILAGVILGPIPALLCAFCTSLIRFFLGTGTLLAFPGSMIGACLCGLAYRQTGKIWAACLGEIIGTGIIGALCAYPISAFILGKEAALFGLVLPFSLSSTVGAVAGAAIIYVLKKSNLLERLTAQSNL